MCAVKVPTLETDRLVLRMWNRRDAADLYEYAKNPNVGPNAGWKPHENIAESRRIISQIFREHSTWAITLRGSGKPIGSIGLEKDMFRTGIRSCELGYSLSEDYWGQGIMTEAAKRVIRYGFEQMHLQVISIRTAENNMRSRRVIEKCGFTYEGSLRKTARMYDGTYRDARFHSLLREEYEEITAARAGGPEGDPVPEGKLNPEGVPDPEGVPEFE